jgi:hypothetical protein
LDGKKSEEKISWLLLYGHMDDDKVGKIVRRKKWLSTEAASDRCKP